MALQKHVWTQSGRNLAFEGTLQSFSPLRWLEKNLVRNTWITLCFAALVCAIPATAEQDTFRWMDFHSDKDQSVVVWVTRALSAEKWTSIREIGVLYDAALVVTTERSSPQASPRQDTFHIWSVSLTTHAVTSLLAGAHLRWLEWMNVSEGAPREIAALYDDCMDCAATTYFTSFHYDMSGHIFRPRWLRGGQAVPVWSGTAPDGVQLTQVYSVLTEPNGNELLGTWSHYDYGKEKPAEDYLYRYDRDPFSGLDRTQVLSGRDAESMKQRLCTSQAIDGLARGQDSALCQQIAHVRPERRPVTTPPANNRGRSVPPGSH